MKIPKILAVTGKFDAHGGRPSGYCKKLFSNEKLYNGGHIDSLQEILKEVENHNIIFWFPDIPNEYDKLHNKIKQINQKCILVTSKNNYTRTYSFLEIVQKSLAVKANLFVIFTIKDDKIKCSLNDVLGNQYFESSSIDEVRRLLIMKATELLQYKRIESFPLNIDADQKFDETEFLNLIKIYAEDLHIPGSERFVGNLSFRCMSGFPAFKSKESIFVSRRNVDKRVITENDFVQVDPRSLNIVAYHGYRKPSVDTPVILRLFKHFKNIKYIFHTHAYVENAPTTKKVIPCGAIEEFDHILDALNQFRIDNLCQFTINLLGHGSIICTKDLNYLKNIKFVKRNFPEFQNSPSVDKFVVLDSRRSRTDKTFGVYFENRMY